MSYLGYPRLHFSGSFLADPSTINNIPNNFSNRNSNLSQLELGWNPNGTGIFDLKECTVTKVIYSPGNETSDPSVDPIIGQSVRAVYSKSPPKMVDLDPDNQGVTEIWGMSLQVGGTGANPHSIKNFVHGDYIEGPFNAMWMQAIGGRSSSAFSAVYQSQLRNLAWDIESSPNSSYLSALHASSSEQLSVNFVLNSHNNSPLKYDFTCGMLKTLTKAPYKIPANIITKLEPLSQYAINFNSFGDKENPGIIPTESFVNQQLVALLGQQNANTYRDKILQATLLAYKPGNISTQFPFGLVTGTIGPQQSATPIYYTPSRSMAPWPLPKNRTNEKYYGHFAPFNAFDFGGQSVVTLNLGNALNTNGPGYNVATNTLGDLSLVYFNTEADKVNAEPGETINLSNAITFAKVPKPMDEILRHSAGIIDYSIDSTLLPKDISLAKANQAILNMPLGLIGEIGGVKTILLAENKYGYNLRADQFVYRMNPGVPSSATQPQGKTATVNIYVTCFGKPAEGIELVTNLIQSEPLTLNKGAQQGTNITTDAKGIAQLTLTAADPDGPRDNLNIDGQVYSVRYGFADLDIQCSYNQDDGDTVSVHIYGEPKIPAEPTWENCIRKILPQYAMLYPIMGRFELNSYESVKKNSAVIKTVLSKPMTDALRMPVTRDMSILRTNAVIDWIKNDMPRE